jgi:hypothetical protein
VPPPNVAYCLEASIGKAVMSAACRFGESEAVFQHLKADDFTFGNDEHDGRFRLDDLAGSLELGHEATK